MPTESEDSTTNEAPEAVEDATSVTELHGLGTGFPSHATVSVAGPATSKHGSGFHHVTSASSLDTGSIGKHGGIRHMGFVSEEESEVHTEVLREKAERGTAAIKELGEIVQSLKEQMALSETFWTGEAADLFRETATVWLKGLQDAVDAIADYPHELIAYADKHEGIITKANAIASGVEDVVWTDEV